MQRVWVADPSGAHAFVIAHVEGPAGSRLQVRLAATGESIVCSDSEYWPANADNDVLESGSATSLQHCNEPALLHLLETNYAHGTIYLWVGRVLLSVNPLESSQSCGERPLKSYAEAQMQPYAIQHYAQMQPHLFAAAERAYRTLVVDGSNVSVVVRPHPKSTQALELSKSHAIRQDPTAGEWREWSRQD